MMTNWWRTVHTSVRDAWRTATRGGGIGEIFGHPDPEGSRRWRRERTEYVLSKLRESDDSASVDAEIMALLKEIEDDAKTRISHQQVALAPDTKTTKVTSYPGGVVTVEDDQSVTAFTPHAWQGHPVVIDDHGTVLTGGGQCWPAIQITDPPMVVDAVRSILDGPGQVKIGPGTVIELPYQSSDDFAASVAQFAAMGHAAQGAASATATMAKGFAAVQAALPKVAPTTTTTHDAAVASATVDPEWPDGRDRIIELDED